MGRGGDSFSLTGLIIRTCPPDPEGRAEVACGLRTEKPWRGDEGPGFNSRRLHLVRFPPVCLAGGFLLYVQVVGTSLCGHEMKQAGTFVARELHENADMQYREYTSDY